MKPSNPNQRARRIGRISVAAALVLGATWLAASRLNADGADSYHSAPLAMRPSAPDRTDAEPPAGSDEELGDVLTLRFGSPAPPIDPWLMLLLDELERDELPITVALGGMPDAASSLDTSPTARTGGDGAWAPLPRGLISGGLAGIGSGPRAPGAGSGGGTASPGDASPDDASPGDGTPSQGDGTPPTSRPPSDHVPVPGDQLTPIPTTPQPPVTPALPPKKVPEPGPLALLALGLLGIGLMRRSMR